MTRSDPPLPGGDRDEPRVVLAPDIDPKVLDQDALRVISRLRRYGHEAYLVGGCVRDLKLGRQPKDYDVATAANPRQVKRIFSRQGRIIGRRFKLVHVVFGDRIVETATFRTEPNHRDGDEDDLLILEDNEYGTAAEDARRRDFTINGLFLDPDVAPWREGGGPESPRILDYVDGLPDLEEGLLRTIGDPMVRIAEDPVRILRAVKFATRLGFRIEEGTWQAICELAPDLDRCSRPRVLEEILRLMRSGTALGAVRMLRACGALRVLLPAVDDYLGRSDDPDPATHIRADSYWRLLQALDGYVHQGWAPTTAICVAVLYLRVVEQEADPETRTLPGPPPADLLAVTGEVIEPFGATSRLPRRELARARRIIVQQRRFTQSRRSRRVKPLLFMRGEDFLESLDLFRLRSVAWGQGWDVYEGWLARYQAALGASEQELSTARGKRRRRPRRRRDRGRRERPDAQAGSPDEDFGE